MSSTTTTKNIFGGKGGLKLGKKAEREKKENLLKDTQVKEIEKEEKLTQKQEEFVDPLAEPIQFDIEERLKCEITKDGDVQKIEVKGEGYLTVLNPHMKRVELQMEIPGNHKILTNNIDKTLFAEKKIISPQVRNYT